jgi:hypothetical protein
MKVRIAEHDITIYTYKQLLDVYKDKEHFPKCYLELNVLQFYAYWKDCNEAKSWLEIAGRDLTKIDYAVPQPWFDHYLELHKVSPRACWSYERDRFSGQALMWDEVVEQVRAKIAVAVKHVINQAIGVEEL